MTERSPAPEADPSPVDIYHSDHTTTQSTEADATDPIDDALSDPKTLLLAKLRHGGDSNDLPEELIDLYLQAAQTFEDGDNRSAARAFRHLLSRDPPEQLRDETLTSLGRIKPDRIALLVVLICALGLALVWVLAVRG